MSTHRRVLLLCSGNSCHSSMAKGWLRFLNRDRFDLWSAGAKPVGYVRSRVISAMADVGIDISGQSSRSTDDSVSPANVLPAGVIEVCSAANEN
ncbi:MAG: hypothetical protein ACK58L_17830 [Planctomycetota bacterium]